MNIAEYIEFLVILFCRLTNETLDLGYFLHHDLSAQSSDPSTSSSEDLADELQEKAKEKAGEAAVEAKVADPEESEAIQLEKIEWKSRQTNTGQDFGRLFKKSAGLINCQVDLAWTVHDHSALRTTEVRNADLAALVSSIYSGIGQQHSGWLDLNQTRITQRKFKLFGHRSLPPRDGPILGAPSESKAFTDIQNAISGSTPPAIEQKTEFQKTLERLQSQSKIEELLKYIQDNKTGSLTKEQFTALFQEYFSKEFAPPPAPTKTDSIVTAKDGEVQAANIAIDSENTIADPAGNFSSKLAKRGKPSNKKLPKKSALRQKFSGQRSGAIPDDSPNNPNSKPTDLKPRVGDNAVRNSVGDNPIRDNDVNPFVSTEDELPDNIVGKPKKTKASKNRGKLGQAKQTGQILNGLGGLATEAGHNPNNPNKAGQSTMAGAPPTITENNRDSHDENNGLAPSADEKLDSLGKEIEANSEIKEETNRHAELKEAGAGSVRAAQRRRGRKQRTKVSVSKSAVMAPSAQIKAFEFGQKRGIAWKSIDDIRAVTSGAMNEQDASRELKMLEAMFKNLHHDHPANLPSRHQDPAQLPSRRPGRGGVEPTWSSDPRARALRGRPANESLPGRRGRSSNAASNANESLPVLGPRRDNHKARASQRGSDICFDAFCLVRTLFFGWGGSGVREEYRDWNFIKVMYTFFKE